MGRGGEVGWRRCTVEDRCGIVNMVRVVGVYLCCELPGISGVFGLVGGVICGFVGSVFGLGGFESALDEAVIISMGWALVIRAPSILALRWEKTTVVFVVYSIETRRWSVACFGFCGSTVRGVNGAWIRFCLNGSVCLICVANDFMVVGGLMAVCSPVVMYWELDRSTSMRKRTVVDSCSMPGYLELIVLVRSFELLREI